MLSWRIPGDGAVEKLALGSFIGVETFIRVDAKRGEKTNSLVFEVKLGAKNIHSFGRREVKLSFLNIRTLSLGLVIDVKLSWFLKHPHPIIWLPKIEVWTGHAVVCE